MPTGEERRGAVCGKIACTVRCRAAGGNQASRLGRAALAPPVRPYHDQVDASRVALYPAGETVSHRFVWWFCTLPSLEAWLDAVRSTSGWPVGPSRLWLGLLLGDLWPTAIRAVRFRMLRRGAAVRLVFWYRTSGQVNPVTHRVIGYGDIWLRGHSTGGYALIPIGPASPLAQRLRIVLRETAVDDVEGPAAATGPGLP